MADQEGLTLLGRIHRKIRKAEPLFNNISFFRKYPIHLLPGTLFNYLSLQKVEKIDQEGEDLFSEDWKNLVILDACRHDIYETVNGETDSRISKGSMSKGFIRKNFSEGDYNDIVYITANPFFHKKKFEKLTGRKPEEVFHEVFHTYETDWSEEENTVLPQPLVRDAETAEKLFPDKRKVVHFMQPHHPFVNSNLVDTGFDDILRREVYENEWDLAMRGEISHETVKEAYTKNLEMVMPYVEELSENLSGKTVLTSDHGNLLGENGLYWHPPRSMAKPLRKVPYTEL